MPLRARANAVFPARDALLVRTGGTPVSVLWAIGRANGRAERLLEAPEIEVTVAPDGTRVAVRAGDNPLKTLYLGAVPVP